MTILHKDIKPKAGDANAGAHVLHYYTFNTVADMVALNDAVIGAVVLAATDVGRVARVGTVAPYQFFLLTDDVTPVWSEISAEGGVGVRWHLPAGLVITVPTHYQYLVKGPMQIDAGAAIVLLGDAQLVVL